MSTLLAPLCGRVLRWLRHGASPLTEPQLSQAIGLSRLLLVIGLVFLHYRFFPESTHTPWNGYDPDGPRVATFVSSFFLFLFFASVPLLSLISGWLFFGFPAQAAQKTLPDRIHRRFRSVFLPMATWNGVYLALVIVLMAHDPANPLLDTLTTDLTHATAWDYANAVFGITQVPIGFQFWFVRDLFVAALVSPAMWLALRQAPYPVLAALGLAWLTGSSLVLFFRPDVAFFFYLGGLLRVKRARLEIGSRATLLLLALYLTLVVLRTLAPGFIEWTGTDRPALVVATTRALRVVGTLACWGIFVHLAATRLGAVLARFAGLAFFVHAAHFPLIEAVKFALWPYRPSPAEGWMVVHYFASVLTTIALTLIAAAVLARLAPNMFALMNGGRIALGAVRIEGPGRPVAAEPLPREERANACADA